MASSLMKKKTGNEGTCSCALPMAFITYSSYSNEGYGHMRSLNYSLVTYTIGVHLFFELCRVVHLNKKQVQIAFWSTVILVIFSMLPDFIAAGSIDVPLT